MCCWLLSCSGFYSSGRWGGHGDIVANNCTGCVWLQGGHCGFSRQGRASCNCGRGIFTWTQEGWHRIDSILTCIFLNWNCWLWIRFSVTFVPADQAPLIRIMNLCQTELHSMGLLPDTQNVRVVHGQGMPGTFSPPPRVSDCDIHHGTCVTCVPWCMSGSLTGGFLWSRWRGKRSRHSRRMRNPQVCVSGKRPISANINGKLWKCSLFWAVRQVHPGKNIYRGHPPGPDIISSFTSLKSRYRSEEKFSVIPFANEMHYEQQWINPYELCSPYTINILNSSPSNQPPVLFCKQ